MRTILFAILLAFSTVIFAAPGDDITSDTLPVRQIIKALEDRVMLQEVFVTVANDYAVQTGKSDRAIIVLEALLYRASQMPPGDANAVADFWKDFFRSPEWEIPFGIKVPFTPAERQGVWNAIKTRLSEAIIAKRDEWQSLIESP